MKSALFTFHTKFTGLTVSKVEVHFSLFTFPAKIGHLEGKVELHFALKMTDQKVRWESEQLSAKRGNWRLFIITASF